MSVPKLRFPEFDGEWTKSRLDELATRRSGHTPDKKFPEYWDGGIKWVSLADSSKLDAGYIGTTDKEISQLGIQNSSAVLLPKGTVILSRDAGVGKSAVLANEMAVSQHFIAWVCDDANQLDNWFLYHWLQIKKEYFERQAVGSTILTIGLPLFKKLKLDHPSLPEQKKIAAFLGVVDAKIAALRERRAGLERYKRGLMQALFTQTLRFTKPDGSAFPDWEEKRLGEVLTIGSGRDYKHLSDGDVPVYGTGGYMTSVNKHLYDGESVCIGRKGTIDKPMFLNEKFWTVDTLFFTHKFRGVMPRFVFAIFLQINWKKHNEASGVPSLSKATIEKLKVQLPHPDEQAKIANALSAMDAKIAAVGDQVTQMEAFKKGLLQQMFV